VHLAQYALSALALVSYGPAQASHQIVATTANVLPAQLATYRQSGINGVMAKPISASALLAEIARVADGSGDAEVAQDALLA
jgi:CheY-like chemotaxis protein